jgi:hypothetical protein
MTKLNVLLILFCSQLFACGQNNPSRNRKSINKTSNTITTAQLSFDTSSIAFLPIDTANPWLFKGATLLNLTNQDLEVIDRLLSDCINVHNSNQDTTKEFSEYIDLKKYKRQYVPFINSNGEKKVYVNCFCISDFANEVDYWKKSLVEVEDGGSCFFHVTINLSSYKYEQLFTNGYG